MCGGNSKDNPCTSDGDERPSGAENGRGKAEWCEEPQRQSKAKHYNELQWRSLVVQSNDEQRRAEQGNGRESQSAEGHGREMEWS